MISKAGFVTISADVRVAKPVAASLTDEATVIVVIVQMNLTRPKPNTICTFESLLEKIYCS